MKEFFQGGGVEVLIWVINAVIGVAVFMMKSRQTLYERTVAKDIDRLEKEHAKVESELKEYREFLERRLRDGTSTMRELVKSVERLQGESSSLRSTALPAPEFKVYCKEHENTHAEQARAIQNLLVETGEVKRAISEVDSYVKGGFQTIMRLLGQKITVGSAEPNPEGENQ
jgi:uncharacterized membrane-anchored protein YhcB (DUF1043 family)